MYASSLMSRKVFKKLGFELSDDVIHNITTCKPWAAEQFLLMLREKVAHYAAAPSHPLSASNSGTGEHFEHGLFSQFSADGLPVVVDSELKNWTTAVFSYQNHLIIISWCKASVFYEGQSQQRPPQTLQPVGGLTGVKGHHNGVEGPYC